MKSFIEHYFSDEPGALDCSLIQIIEWICLFIYVPIASPFVFRQTEPNRSVWGILLLNFTVADFFSDSTNRRNARFRRPADRCPSRDDG